MTEMLQRPLDTRISPGGILTGHPDDQTSDLKERARPPRAASRIRPLRSDELAMPAEDRVRRDDGRDLRQQSTAEPLPEDRQAATFVIGQCQSSAVELRLQNAVLLSQVLKRLESRTPDRRGSHRRRAEQTGAAGTGNVSRGKCSRTGAKSELNVISAPARCIVELTVNLCMANSNMREHTLLVLRYW